MINTKTNTTILIFVVVTAVAAFLIALPYGFEEGMQRVLLYLPGIDKAAHFAEHFFIVLGLNFLLIRTFLKRNIISRIIICLIFSLIFSITDESLQAHAPGRSYEYADIAANILGSLTAAVILCRSYISTIPFWLIILLTISINSMLIYASYNRLAPYYRGMRHEKHGEYVNAMVEYQNALNSGNTSPGLLNAIAWLNLAFLDGNMSQSLRYAEEAVNQDPENADYLDTYGLALVRNNRPEEALTALQKAFSINPEIYTINFHLGLTFLSLGREETALRHFRTQLEYTTDGSYGEKSRYYIDHLADKKQKSQKMQ